MRNGSDGRCLVGFHQTPGTGHQVWAWNSRRVWISPMKELCGQPLGSCFFEVVLVENLKIEEFCCYHEVAWSFGDINFEIHLKDPSGPNFVSSIVKGNIKADEFQTFLWVLNVLWNHASLLWPRAKPSTSRKKKINHEQSADHLDLDFTWVGNWGNLSGNVNQWIISYLRKKRYVSYSSTSVTIRRPKKNQLFGTTVTCQLVQRKWRVARCLQVIELASNFALRPLCHEILLMEKILANQLRLVVYPIIYRALAPSKRWLGMGFRPSTVSQTTVSLRLAQMPTSSGTRGPTTPWPTRNLMMLRTRFLRIRKHGWNTEPQNVGRNCSDAMVLFVVCIWLRGSNHKFIWAPKNGYFLWWQWYWVWVCLKSVLELPTKHCVPCYCVQNVLCPKSLLYPAKKWW